MKTLWYLIICLWMGEASLEAVTTRIKDVTKIRGSSEYGVSGIGLVVGLAGDGDRNLAPTMQAFSNLLQRNNIVIAPEAIQSKNVAIVAVQAKISSRDKEGSMVDVIVSSMGDAKSLSGGTLMRTLLFGPDQTIAFATVQGTISVGGFNAGSGGAGGASIRKNHPLVGQIIKGARVIMPVPESQVIKESPKGRYFELELNQPDFTTAARIAEAINAKFPDVSSAEDERYIRVGIPEGLENRFVDYFARIEPITFTPDIRARVLINEKTGTILATSPVKISSCAISHGSLTISIANTQGVSQPGAFAPENAETQQTNATDVGIDQTDTALKALPEMPTIQEVAAELNKLGVSTRDIISIFQAMEKLGALKAEIIYQ
ncbi:flagellar basal body P-ring protein FlgI [Verrucomicrobia bacterium]|jgi:flagellar P-ring protein precursor FlgI|nr:flagellar basal body P-ring protein FlgI [Verrucomicrobiota bacterium]